MTTSLTPLQSSRLHWLRVQQRVDYKVAVMAFQALNGLSPPYLDQLVRVADPPGRHRLRSSLSHRLQVPAYRLATVGRRSFPFAASILWNSLPPDIVICLPVRLLPQTKDVLVPAIISRHFAVTVHISTSLSYVLQ